jgi:Alpha-glutamyl/putrescinyl thymine pyrophosphorylase clade 2
LNTSDKTLVVDTWQSFAVETVKSHDLDPTYDLLANLRKPYGEAFVARACLHMLMFYDLRDALELAKLDGKKYWEHIDKNYPHLRRGTERRHFRSINGWKTVEALREAYPRPEEFMEDNYDSDLRIMEAKLRRWPGFGPYFVWKAADYQDRIMGFPITFRTNLELVPDQPRKSAATFFPGQDLVSVLEKVSDAICEYPAPGLPNRPCGLSEAETVLCMLKTYFTTKAAWLGKDIMLRYKELGDTKFARYLPPPVNVERWRRGEYREQV